MVEGDVGLLEGGDVGIERGDGLVGLGGALAQVAHGGAEAEGRDVAELRPEVEQPGGDGDAGEPEGLLLGAAGGGGGLSRARSLARLAARAAA